MKDYLPAYGMTRAELDRLNTKVCEVAGLSIDKCPTNSYHDAMTALENTGARWVIRHNKDGYSVKVWTRGRGNHPLLCVAICQAIVGKETA
jgi:hypothetical protein